MTENTPLAETVTGIGLFINGIVAGVFRLEWIAIACFVTVGLIACARSYTRSMGKFDKGMR